MEFERTALTAMMISSNTMAVEDELLLLPSTYSELGHPFIDPYFHQPGFLDHQLAVPSYGSDAHHQGQESISLCHNAGPMLVVDSQPIDYTFEPSCESSMPPTLPLQLPLQPSTHIQPQRAINTNTLRVGDAEAVWQFYDERFQLFEQRGCIILARILIKVISPNKKKLYPYSKGNAAPPPWWPQHFGTDEDERIQHVDPSYIPKTPRIFLLIHLIRLITEPHHRQHPEIQGINLDIGRLEAITMQTISTWFQEERRHAAKKPILEEVFHVAKAEASLKAGNIDDQSIIHIWPAKTLRPKYRKRSAVYNPTANDFDLELPRDMSDLAPGPQFLGSVFASGSVPEVPLEVPPCPRQAGHGIAALVGTSAVSLPPLPLPMDMIQLPAVAGEYVVDNGQEVLPVGYVDQPGPMGYGYVVGGGEELVEVVYTPALSELCRITGENVIVPFSTGLVV
ncbi:hypothetical protein QBC41DRAFT_320285 [Cercophora samala]|uniref:Subtelomeric hrmA-associated cluster protein AFUB-079030/YDR124W-like helical bundle domain-containing protein n=1 Tax=Cercophora samala TaxID=330535 RepID=A0AA39ZE51_9PEZI|nr:hypothetical protein QBC41DRAFT_320285 [Cercophora samala]